MFGTKKLIKQAIRRRFVVDLPGGGGSFTGVLVEHDKTHWVFDDCQSIATNPGGTPTEIPGRIWVVWAQSPAPTLQETTP